MPERRRLVDALLFGSGIVYAALVFFLRGEVDPSLFIVLALVIVALRLGLGDNGIGGWRQALLAAAAALAGLALVDVELAARAYPVLLSLAAGGVFAITLLRPPSLVERLALAAGDVWSPALRSYCRNVTLVWALWLVVNAAIAAALALAGDDRSWALWTGLFSYMISGALLAGERLLRRTIAGRQPR